MTELHDPPPGRAGSVLEQAPARRRPSGPATVSLVAAGWALLYALYRGDYGLGGTVGMFGTPTSWTEWRQINLVAAAILLMAAALPVAALASIGLLSAFGVVGKFIVA